MKLGVIRQDGRAEIITLVPPLTVHYGDKLARISCGDGTDHFFTELGAYDGWGRAAPPDGMSEEEAKIAIEAFEASREIYPKDNWP